MTKRKVLIPLDGSDFGREILSQIRRLFTPDQFQLHLVHVAFPNCDNFICFS